MKIKIIENQNLDEDSITITCHTLTDEVKQLIEAFKTINLIGTKRGADFILSPKDILFFETDNEIVHAHTIDNFYETKYKLYELEAMLSVDFQRISKSSIVNINEISAIERNITSNRQIYFFNSSKSVYVSRKYYPILKEKLNERSL